MGRFWLVGLGAILAISASSIAADSTSLPRTPGIASDVQEAVKLQEEGQWSQAAAAYERILSGAEMAPAADSLSAAVIRARLGEVYCRLGRLPDAEAQLVRAIKTLEGRLGNDHLQVAAALATLGDVYWLGQQYAKAESVYRRGLVIARAKLPGAHPLVTYNINGLGIALHHLGRFDESESLQVENLKLREESLGKDHPHVLITLENLGVLYCDMRRYDDAARTLDQWMERNQRGQSDRHPSLYTILLTLGESHSALEHWAESERYLSRALVQCAGTAGKESTDAARVWTDLALVLSKKHPRELDKAEEFARRAMKVYTAADGPDRRDIAHTMLQLGDVLASKRQYAEAEDLIKTGLDIFRSKQGDRDPEVAYQTIRLVDLYLLQDRPAEAEPLCRHCLEVLETQPGKYQDALIELVIGIVPQVYNRIGQSAQGAARLAETVRRLEKRLGKDHPDFALALRAAGNSCNILGFRDQAVEYLVRGLEIRRRTLGNDCPAVADMLHALAMVYLSVARYAEAERCFNECLDIRQKSRRVSRDVASCLSGLGFLYQRTGRLVQAEATYRRCLAILEKEPDGTTEALVAGYWGKLCMETGRHGEAEAHLKKSLAYWHEHTHEHGPNLAWDHTYLGQLYFASGRHADSERHFIRAIELFRSIRGGDHPDLSVACSGLAMVHLATGRKEEAEKLLDQALANLERSPLANQRDKAIIQENKVSLDLACGDWREAVLHCTEARRTSHQRMVDVLPALSPGEQIAYLSLEDRQSLAAALCIGLEYASHAEAVEASAEWLLNAKSLAAEFAAQGILAARQSKDPEVISALSQLTSVRQQLAHFVIDPSGLAPPDHLAIQELALARKIGLLTRAHYRSPAWISLSDLRRALRPHTVLVEVALFPVGTFDDLGTIDLLQPAHYVAWIVPRDGEGEVRLIDFGKADAIDQAVAEARLAIEAYPQLVNKIGVQAAVEIAEKASAKLSDIVWKPLEKHLAPSVESLLVSPDGALWLFPWESLPAGDGKFLVEDLCISYAISGREFLQQPEKSAARGAALFANPDYDAPPSEPPATSAASLLASLVGSFFAPARPEGLLQGATVEHLPVDHDYIESLSASLKRYVGQSPDVYLETQARESLFKTIAAPRVLVVETHGFFLPDNAFDNLPVTEEEQQFWTEFTNWRLRGSQRDRIVLVPNPLLRCGLALAGANHHQDAGGSTDDGILTGLEIITGDLRGTELVVLVACETGVGALRYGEGVGGLRHAFQLAGARTVVATLWSVDLERSNDLVGRFLDNLSSTNGMAAAFHQAQLDLILHLRETTGSAHPWLWAGFTLTGDGQ